MRAIPSHRTLSYITEHGPVNIMLGADQRTERIDRVNGGVHAPRDINRVIPTGTKYEAVPANIISIRPNQFA